MLLNGRVGPTQNDTSPQGEQDGQLAGVSGFDLRVQSDIFKDVDVAAKQGSQALPLQVSCIYT